MGLVLEDRKVMQLYVWSAEDLRTRDLPGPCAVLRMADEPSLIAGIHDKENAVYIRNLCFCDTEDGPSERIANEIVEFYRNAKLRGLSQFVAQCQVGVGRSAAVVMALSEIEGAPRTVISWAYNRRLYRHVLRAGGKRPPVEPLVSITVRVKYDLDTLSLFLFSLKRQRYQNWEAIIVEDGPLCYEHDSVFDQRFKWYQREKQGRWGHPHRQWAFEQCQGDWIGTQNDDNYLTPGFIEQLVEAAEQKGANIAMCQPLHRYSGWKPTDPGTDLCTWIARKELIRQVPWTRTDFEADREYLLSLMKLPEAKAVAVKRPLVVKN